MTAPTPYADRHRPPTDLEAGPLGARWGLRWAIYPARHDAYAPRGDGWLTLGHATTEAATVNGVTYGGRVSFGYRPADGARAQAIRADQWRRLTDTGTTRDYGLTEAAARRMTDAAAELAEHYPTPTAADLRDAWANWARDAAGHAASQMLHKLNADLGHGETLPIGYGPTVAEAIRAEFRRLICATPEAQRAAGDANDGWGRLEILHSLGAERADAEAETPERADAEARADADAERAALRAAREARDAAILAAMTPAQRAAADAWAARHRAAATAPDQ